MPQAKVSMTCRRVSPKASVIDITGEVTAFAENVLMEAYAEASAGGVSTIILNFGNMEYMNSSGVGLLVTLLIRMRSPETTPAHLWIERALPAHF